jgi:hypothetical protein
VVDFLQSIKHAERHRLERSISLVVADGLFIVLTTKKLHPSFSLLIECWMIQLLVRPTTACSRREGIPFRLLTDCHEINQHSPRLLPRPLFQQHTRRCVVHLLLQTLQILIITTTTTTIIIMIPAHVP